MPKPCPREFRDDVVAVARLGESPLKQIAKDFGISEGCLSTWLKKADVEAGHRPGLDDADRKELREVKKRVRLLEQLGAPPACGGERGPAAGGCVSVAGESAGKVVFPLVREMAATGAPIRVPVAVAMGPGSRRVAAGKGC